MRHIIESDRDVIGGFQSFPPPGLATNMRIKILPSDMMCNDDGGAFGASFTYDDGAGNKGVKVSPSSKEIYAFVTIPEGWTATDVAILGSSTDTVTVYEGNIAGTWSASIGSAAMNVNIDITDVDSSASNFLVIQVAVNSTADLVFGGYVDFERI